MNLAFVGFKHRHTGAIYEEAVEKTEEWLHALSAAAQQK